MRSYVSAMVLRAWPVWRQCLPFLIGGLCLWLLSERLDPASLTQIGPALADLPAARWGAAIVATAVSFWALGRYDILFHRQFETGFDGRAAALSGVSAIAVGQVLGLGILTGALTRWRILPGLSPAQATKIALAVAVSFLVCLVLLISGVTAALPGQFLPIWLPWVLLGLLGGILVLATAHSALSRVGFTLSLPPLRAMVQMVLLSAIDTAAAATALYLLLSADMAVGWVSLYAAYLLALFAALVSGTPGGVGPFELALVAALPGFPEPELLAAVLAFRLVYYALPALLAVPLLAYPLRPALTTPPRRKPTPDARALYTASRAEHGVCRQNGAYLLPAHGADLMVLKTDQTITALFDPLHQVTARMLPVLAREARHNNRFALVYKCTARTAVAARQAGWQTLHIANEARLDPIRFATDGARFRQLRRKLRQARAAGLCVSREAELPLGCLRRIDLEWCTRNGHARGLSMGRFCPEYIRYQRVYVARQDDEIMGFVTFHMSHDEWCLDLMRTSNAAPSGTMHLLVKAAIDDAAALGVPRLSLAAMERCPSPGMPWLQRWILHAIQARRGAGLSQFKTSFGPDIQPLYALAPHPLALAIGLADLALAIHRAPANPPQDHDEEKAFASLPQT